MVNVTANLQTVSITVNLAGGSGNTNIPTFNYVSITQSNTTAAVPVLTMTQADVSEEFVRYIGTASAGVLTQSIVNNTDANTMTQVGWLKIYVRDDGNQIADGAYYIPFFSIA